MYQQHRDLVPVVWLKADKPSGVCIFSRPNHANETEPLWPVPCQKRGGSDGEISRKGIVAPGNRDPIGSQRIFHSQPRFRTLKFEHGGQVVEDLFWD